MVSMIKTHWNLLSFFSRPVAIILALCNVALIFAMLWVRYQQGLRVKRAQELLEGK
jgi:hypothetical protein